MKVLGSHVTFVRRNSPTVPGSHLKVHAHRHEDVKPYVCCEFSKAFCTGTELRHHAVKHSNAKLFCCGLCAKDFKYKKSVPIHFKRCAVEHGFTGV